jgi:hypothetical protein
MCDAGDIDDSLGVIDRIDDSIIANPDAPALFIAMQLLATGRDADYR